MKNSTHYEIKNNKNKDKNTRSKYKIRRIKIEKINAIYSYIKLSKPVSKSYSTYELVLDSLSHQTQ